MRRLCLALGLLVLTAIWLGPLLTIWRESVAAHMLAHMGVVAIAAPLIALGLSGRVAPMKAMDGPALIAMNGCPPSVNATTSQSPDGVSWSWTTESILESGNTEQ